MIDEAAHARQRRALVRTKTGLGVSVVANVGCGVASAVSAAACILPTANPYADKISPPVLPDVAPSTPYEQQVEAYLQSDRAVDVQNALDAKKAADKSNAMREGVSLTFLASAVLGAAVSARAYVATQKQLRNLEKLTVSTAPSCTPLPVKLLR